MTRSSRELPQLGVQVAGVDGRTGKNPQQHVALMQARLVGGPAGCDVVNVEPVTRRSQPELPRAFALMIPAVTV